MSERDEENVTASKPGDQRMLTRRRFMKRTGAASVAAIAGVHIVGSSNALAVVSGNPCGVKPRNPMVPAPNMTDADYGDGYGGNAGPGSQYQMTDVGEGNFRLRVAATTAAVAGVCAVSIPFTITIDGKVTPKAGGNIGLDNFYPAVTYSYTKTVTSGGTWPNKCTQTWTNSEAADQIKDGPDGQSLFRKASGKIYNKHGKLRLKIDMSPTGTACATLHRVTREDRVDVPSNYTVSANRKKILKNGAELVGGWTKLLEEMEDIGNEVHNGSETEPDVDTQRCVSLAVTNCCR